MSRALDEGIREALSDGNHESIFEEIASVLSCDSGVLLEIELLGYSHRLSAGSYYLQDGNAIAIPKLRLVQAFIHARHVFRKHVETTESSADDRIRNATAVMLLFDPEHLTAANARKRMLDSETGPKPGQAARLLLREKLFVDSLLTSRLHRHTKSPTLWSHRRWLMGRLGENGVAIERARDLRTVVLVSAERHPRNYYAWSHARHLGTPGDQGWTDADERRTMVADTKKWCFSHHDDVSGWMFLAFLLEGRPAEAALVFTETLELAESFRWRNESVWYFLRNMVLGAAVAAPQQERFSAAWRAARADSSEGSEERRTLDGLSSWISMCPGTM
ncbi:hypothetical protein CDD83_10237 [Cordyceps sp. RAO-2017]|nr:hypothetical protein CDD83_10237 [Cordyceps sp. RAO-2017]